MTGPTGSIFSLRSKYQTVEVIAEYTDRTATSKKFSGELYVPHNLLIYGRYDTGDRISIHVGSSVANNIVRYITENFGQPGSYDSRWDNWQQGGLNIGFVDSKDAVAFMLWLRGKLIQEIDSYYGDEG